MEKDNEFPIWLMVLIAILTMFVTLRLELPTQTQNSITYTYNCYPRLGNNPNPFICQQVK